MTATNPMNNRGLDIKRLNLQLPIQTIWRHEDCKEDELAMLRLAEPIGYGFYCHHVIVAPPQKILAFDDNNYLELLIHNQN